MRFSAIVFTILIGLSTGKSFAQNGFNTESKDSTNLYHYSLIKYCEYLDKLEERPTIVYVEKNYLITNGLPNKIRSYEIQYLDQLGIKKHLRGKTAMTLVRIVPLRVKEDDFFVNVIPFGVSYKRNNFNYVNGGGLGVKFKFDQTINGLIFTSIEMGAI